MLIAIHPDDYTFSSTRCDALSPRWSELLKIAGHQVRWVDVRQSDILRQLKGCDGFMWRYAQFPDHLQIARCLLPIIERELGLCVYPDQRSCWHFDDKVKQSYLFDALAIPTPKTRVYCDRQEALDFALKADYPLVIKLRSGASSRNVRLLENSAQAKRWVQLLFGSGIGSMADYSDTKIRSIYHRLRYVAKILLTDRPFYHDWEIHKDYILFQEFIPDNSFDIRVHVIGNRAFGLRRFNRPGDFRASGGHQDDMNPAEVDLDAVRLAFDVSKRLGMQCAAIDILKRGDEFLISEVSYTSYAWAVTDCPGHWELEGDELIWKDGSMSTEEAQIEDFLIRLESHFSPAKHFESSLNE